MVASEKYLGPETLTALIDLLEKGPATDIEISRELSRRFGIDVNGAYKVALHLINHAILWGLVERRGYHYILRREIFEARSS